MSMCVGLLAMALSGQAELAVAVVKDVNAAEDRLQVEINQCVTVVKQQMVDGKEVTVAMQECRPALVEIKPDKRTRIHAGTGERVARREALGRLKPEDVVVLAAGDFQAKWGKALRPKSLVFCHVALNGPGSPGGYAPQPAIAAPAVAAGKRMPSGASGAPGAPGASGAPGGPVPAVAAGKRMPSKRSSAEAATSPKTAEKGKRPSVPKLSPTEQAVLDRINAVRKEKGLSEVAFDPGLTRVARAHQAANWRDGVRVKDADPRSPGERFDDFGIQAGHWGVTMGGGSNAENLAAEWAANPVAPHNILHPDMNSAGVAASPKAGSTVVVFAQLSR